MTALEIIAKEKLEKTRKLTFQLTYASFYRGNAGLQENPCASPGLR
jgi:hypothetical protein